MVSRKDIAEHIAPKCSDSANASEIVNEVFEFIEKKLTDGEPVRITNFGTFKLVNRQARKGKNPRTGNPMDIPAKRITKFTPGKKLRETVNS